MNATLEKIITDFMNNLSCSSWKREGRDKPKEHLINYFVAHGYGQQHYSEEDIRWMFKEMEEKEGEIENEGEMRMRFQYLTHSQNISYNGAG